MAANGLQGDIARDNARDIGDGDGNEWLHCFFS
jgi:hypothetical protein